MTTLNELQTQLERLRETGFDSELVAQAAAHGLPPAFLFAIASRETNCRNELGDWRDSAAHGVGILQVDVQHECARQARDDGSWRTAPGALIAFAAQLLADNLRQAQQAFPQLAADEQFKIAASGYNSGMALAIAGAHHGDSDRHTTGRNYGADVVSRMKAFETLLGADKAGGQFLTAPA